ncbi:MAG: hypothetical protein K2Y40_24770 [Reyranella sp.]|nr:hypothetical protein [Reyranella sp.]
MSTVAPSDSPALVALRKSLAEAADGPDAADAKALAYAALRSILDAIEAGVCPLGDWERRCLAAAITSLRGGRFAEARTRARQALWPDENRRTAAVAKFPPRPGMISLAELEREFAAAQAMPGRGGAGGGKTA